MKQVVILAGGKGTRLRERLGGLPKPLIDVCGVPLLERQIRLAKRYGFTHVLVLVNHAAQRIIDYCASKQDWGLDIACIDDGEPRGTAGATLAVYERLAAEFLVMYGDTMLEVDLERFHSFHASAGRAAATLFLHPNDHPHDSDLVEVDDDGHILAFHPCPHNPSRYYPNLVNAALYWVTKQGLEPWRGTTGVLDFGKDLFPAMLRSGQALCGFISPEYIKDIGTPSRLDKVCADLSSGKIARATLERDQAMVFIDRDGTINREVDHLREAERFELLPEVGEAIRRLNASEYRCCVVTNQPVIARGECSFEELRRIHYKMETLLGRQGAFVDRIYYCPHHPEGGFAGERAELKIECDCRKPKTGMIERAAREFNVARDRSWMVGDSSVDIETARRAHLKSILVESGVAGLDYRAWASPHTTVPDLASAVSFILDVYPELFRQCAEIARAIEPGTLVLVGGQARSGKSTFAAVLRDALQALGKRAVILSTDRWLKKQSERTDGVLGRYDMVALQKLADTLAGPDRKPTVLSLSGYHKIKREQIEAVETVSISGTDVVVIEGTVALALNMPASARKHRFHVEIDEAERKERILREYRLRGLPASEALQIYQARREDEFPTIERLVKSDMRVHFANPKGAGEAMKLSGNQ